LGGRPRRRASAERARQRVSHALGDTYKALDRALPAFAVHLRNAIKPGTTLSYAPDHAIRWTINRRLEL